MQTFLSRKVARKQRVFVMKIFETVRTRNQAQLFTRHFSELNCIVYLRQLKGYHQREMKSTSKSHSFKS